MKLMQGNQRGLTLVEVTVGVLIMGLVGLAASAAIIQVVNAGRNSNHMSALGQVQDAGYWVSRDGLQAQQVIDDNSATLPIDIIVSSHPEIADIVGTKILLFKWQDWGGGDTHEIVYSLQSMGSGSLNTLWRYERINTGQWTATLVAQYIDASATSCYWTDASHSSFNFKVTATLQQETESRIYEIKPRPQA
jgi:prepilin-type N-terminal cleavage/methylation domain-containing protein